MTKLKKAIKGTQATSKLPMSKESASAPKEMTRDDLNKAIDFKFRNESGELAGPPEDTTPYWDRKRTEREKIITEAPEVSPVPAPVAQTAQASTATPVVKAPTIAPVKEAPLSSMLTHEVYTKLTGKPWSTAKKEGLTDGSAASNLKLKAMLLDKANKVPASKSTVDKPANVKLESKDIADLREKMTTPLVKKAPATATSKQAKADSTRNAKVAEFFDNPENVKKYGERQAAKAEAELLKKHTSAKSLKDMTKPVAKSASETAHDKTLDARRRQQSEATRNISTKGVSDQVRKNQGDKYSKVTVRTAFQKQQDEDDEFERIKGYRPAPRGIVPINRGKSVTAKPITRKGKGVIQNPVGIYGLR